MDSEHRHDLKTNELEEIIEHPLQFLKTHQNWVIGIVAVIVIYLGWSPFVATLKAPGIRKQQQTTAAVLEVNKQIGTMLYSEIEVADDVILAAADKLEAAAKGASGQAAAFAYIKYAQALRTDLHYKDIVDDAFVAEQIAAAIAAYEKAAKLAGPNVNLAAMADFGLALCKEELGQIDAAKAAYAGIVANQAYAPTIFVGQAQYRLDTMDDYAEKFVFVDAPIVEEGPAIPEGFDAAAAEAIKSGDIVIQGQPTETTEEK